MRLLVSLIILCSPLKSQFLHSLMGLKGLEGLDSVFIIIDSLDQKTESEVLSIKQIEHDLEVKLRLAGLKVFKDDDTPSIVGGPILRFQLFAMYHKLGNTGWASYVINLSIYELATFLRGPVGGDFGWVKRWETSDLITLGEDKFEDVRDFTSNAIDGFIIAYLKANPKN